MRKVLAAPGTYIQHEGALSALADECEGLGASKAYLIVDSFIDGMYRDSIVSSFESKGMPYVYAVFGGECSDDEITKHREALNGSDIVFGIGGGKSIDTAKAVGYYAGGLDVAIVPTAASSDAPCSRLSVIYTPDGQFDHYLPLVSNPTAVIMDVELIAKAPIRLLVSGLGDAFATYYEAAACVRSNAMTMVGGHPTHAAFAMAKLCHELVTGEGAKAVAAVRKGARTPAVESVIEANTLLSGLGFESSGLAAAHAIHNGLTALAGTHRYLHGEKVAYGTLAQLVLDDQPLDVLRKEYRFFRTVGLPTTLEGIGIADATDEDLLKVGELACAPDDTMGNMPFAVAPGDVAAALRAVDELNGIID